MIKELSFFWNTIPLRKPTVVSEKLVKLCDVFLVEVSFLFINFMNNMMLNVCITQPTMSGVIMSCRFRVTCNKIITHKMFDHVVLVIIFLNCITIAMERPRIDPSSAVSNVTSYAYTHASVSFKTKICCRNNRSENWDTFGNIFIQFLKNENLNCFKKFWLNFLDEVPYCSLSFWSQGYLAFIVFYLFYLRSVCLSVSLTVASEWFAVVYLLEMPLVNQDFTSCCSVLSDMEFTVQVIGSKNFPQPIAREAKMLCMCQLNNWWMEMLTDTQCRALNCLSVISRF